MNLDDAPPGYPFGDDYPEYERDEACGPLREAIDRQAAELAQRRNEPWAQRQLIATVQRRRRDRADLVQFDALPRPDGFHTLLARGEILVTAATYRDTGARGFLDSAGMQQVELGCEALSASIVRLVNPALEAQALADTAKLLRQRGFAASVNHVTPLGPVGKALGGPEPTTGVGPFSDYPVHSEGPPARVAIIDTGVSREIRADGWLTDVPRTADNIDPLDVLPNGPDNFLDLSAGHGTLVAGVVKQVAPGATVHMYRTLDTDGFATDVQVACAMIQAVRDGAQILNLSLGAQTLDNLPPVAMVEALEVIGAIERERQETVVIVAAAGNFADTTPVFPAALRRVVSVAGLAPDMLQSQWSTRGFWVTMATVGQGVRSSYVEGTESFEVDPEPDRFGPSAWAASVGTSFAAPQIAGAIARLSQELNLTPQQALVRLLRAGRPLPDFGQTVKILPGL